VVLDNGRVHNFGNFQEWSRDQEQSRSFTIKGHKIQSIASGFDHGVMVTMRGAIFGFGCNNDHQLGVVDPSAQSGDIILTLTEMFTVVTKFNRAARLPHGSVST
jgi:alpha-tubulin suppressor-like RCC1 family protein